MSADEAGAELDGWRAAQAAVGLEGCSPETFVRHHRANAALAATFDARTEYTKELAALRIRVEDLTRALETTMEPAPIALYRIMSAAEPSMDDLRLWHLADQLSLKYKTLFDSARALLASTETSEG